MLNKKLIKISLISSLILTGTTLSANENFLNKIAFWDNTDKNFVNFDEVNFLLQNGFDITEDIRDTQNLKLMGEKLYIEDDKKILLIKVINKTGNSIHVEREMGYGTAHPKILAPFNTGYVIVYNKNSEPVKKYDIENYNDNLTNNLTNKELTYISRYFDPSIRIYQVNNVDVTPFSSQEWVKNKINEHNFVLMNRVDRVVDDNSFRYGLFLSGFIKVNRHFYKPVSYYFTIKEGKIMRMFFTEELLRFEDFSKLIISQQ